MHVCKLCDSKQTTLRHPRVRDNEEIKVIECTNCGLVFLSSFNHINDKFYQDSGMLNGKIDLKKYRQQSYKDDERRAKYLRDKIIGKKILDFGCGAGGFLHLIKESAETVAGVELDSYLNKVLNREGIKCFSNIEEIQGSYDIITAFHVIEHLINPIEILEKLKEYLTPNGQLIIEVPNADDALLTLYESEAFANFTYWSCHTYLFNNYTLSKLANKAGFRVKMLKQVQRYPLSNHLYWLSKGKPGGHSHYLFLNNPVLEKEYEHALASIGKCDTIIMELEL